MHHRQTLCHHTRIAALFLGVSLCVFGLVLVTRVSAWTLGTSFDGDLGDANFFQNYISNDYSHSGSNSTKFSMFEGVENDGQYTYQLGSDLHEGDELWVRVYIYPPIGFRWDCNPITKILRITVAGSDGSNVSYHSLLSTRQTNYGCGSGTTFGYMVTGSEMNSSQSPPPICQNTNTEDGGGYLVPGQWHSIEMYLKVSATNGILRAWHNGVLRNEYLYPTIPSGGYIPFNRTENWTQHHLLGWWNGGPVQNQSIYFDDFVETNEAPPNQDLEGNPMIGPRDWISYSDTTPPAQPTGLIVR